MPESYDLYISPSGVTLTAIGKAGATAIDLLPREARDLAAQLLMAAADAEEIAQQEQMWVDAD